MHQAGLHRPLSLPERRPATPICTRPRRSPLVRISYSRYPIQCRIDRRPSIVPITAPGESVYRLVSINCAQVIPQPLPPECPLILTRLGLTNSAPPPFFFVCSVPPQTSNVTGENRVLIVLNLRPSALIQAWLHWLCECPLLFSVLLRQSDSRLFCLLPPPSYPPCIPCNIPIPYFAAAPFAQPSRTIHIKSLGTHRGHYCGSPETRV